jgi:hypothetical protein
MGVAQDTVNGRGDQGLALELAGRARTASHRDGGCARLWREIQQDFARDLAPGLRLEETVLRSLGTAGEEDVAAQGLELHETIRTVLGDDRDFRGHLAVTAMLLEDLVRFEREELASAKTRMLAPTRAASVQRPKTTRTRVTA